MEKVSSLAVKNGLVVVGPGDISGYLGDPILEKLASGKIFKMNGVDPPPLGIHRVGKDVLAETY